MPSRRVLATVAVALVVVLGTCFLIKREYLNPASAIAKRTDSSEAKLAHEAHSPAIAIETIGSGECLAEVKPEAELGAGDRCVLELIAKRCGNLDACFVKCFASGNARNIGGGCYHMCNYSLWKPWSLPDGFNKCYLPGEPRHLN